MEKRIHVGFASHFAYCWVRRGVATESQIPISVRYAFVNFPIETLYPAAYKERVAEGCAADEGHFCFQGRD